MSKYKVEVIADNSGKWCSNSLTFDTEEAARVYGADLFMRWLLVREWRVVPAEPEPEPEPVPVPVLPAPTLPDKRLSGSFTLMELRELLSKHRPDSSQPMFCAMRHSGDAWRVRSIGHKYVHLVGKRKPIHPETVREVWW